MFSFKEKSIILILLLLFLSVVGFAQNDEKNRATLEKSVQFLKNYFFKKNNWQIVQPQMQQSIKGLVNYIQDQPIDDILKELKNAKLTQGNYVVRLPKDCPDSLKVPGYISAILVQQKIASITQNYQHEVKIEEIMVPSLLIQQAEDEVATIPEGKGIQLFIDSVYVFPDSLIIPEVIPDSVLNSPEQFHRLIQVDNLRKLYIERKRIAYNDSVKRTRVNEVSKQYRKQRYDEGLAYRINQYRKRIKHQNNEVLKIYNEKVVAAVNDSIKTVIDVLANYADFIDTTKLSVVNLVGESEDILLQNGKQYFSRIWLKNEQNDSLQVLLKNMDKKTIKVLIDDNVTFSRFKKQQNVDFDFETLKTKFNKVEAIGNSYELETPWRIGGDGTAGFTQTYLKNPKNGGKSAFSTLVVLKGFANYSRKDGKVKLENSAEIRSGWIRPGGKEEEFRKNDDKVELTSRLGISAFRKWYYSAELNFNTQLFRGYKYPITDKAKPISAFLSPSKTYFKVGMDYKPNPRTSIFLSPLTLKNYYVRDTSLINQTSFGISKYSKSFWEPGLNGEIRYNTTIWDNISYETKYKMFINYKDPFKKFDINWENLFKMPLNDYINMTFLVHLMYDDNVMFPILNAEGKKIGEKAKLQIKEFFSIGFAYKINRKVMRTHRIR